MASTSGCRILVVDDLAINRKLVRKLCKNLNLSFEEAENGKVAVDYFKQGRCYDLVLMDKEMPVMDGHEATRQLRSLGMRSPIVALSSDDSQANRDRFFGAGANGFETKPMSSDQFLRLLAKHVGAPAS